MIDFKVRIRKKNGKLPEPNMQLKLEIKLLILLECKIKPTANEQSLTKIEFSIPTSGGIHFYI